MDICGAQGILSYLHALEKVTVERISACGDAAVLGALYLLGEPPCAVERLLAATPVHLHQSRLAEHAQEVIDGTSMDRIAGLSGRLIVTYNDLTRGAPVHITKYETKKHLSRTLLRGCRPALTADGLPSSRFCAASAPRVMDGRKRATLLLAPVHPLRAMVAAILSGRTDPLSRMLDSVADAHSFFVGRSALMCSYVSRAPSLPVAWLRLRARLYAFLCALAFRRRAAADDALYLNQSENVGDG